MGCEAALTAGATQGVLTGLSPKLSQVCVAPFPTTDGGSRGYVQNSLPAVAAVKRPYLGISHYLFPILETEVLNILIYFYLHLQNIFTGWHTSMR